MTKTRKKDIENNPVFYTVSKHCHTRNVKLLTKVKEKIHHVSIVNISVRCLKPWWKFRFTLRHFSYEPPVI